MKCRWFVLILGAAAFTCKVPAQHAQPATHTANIALPGGDSSTPRLQPGRPRYQLRPGDSFDVDFALTPEFNETVSVQPDGYGSFKAVGTILVQGKTLPELTEAIRAAYAKILHDPQVTVLLKDFEKPYFVAAGQVVRPGKYDLRSDMTLSEALAVAGGINERGKLSQVVLYRHLQNGFEGKAFNVKKLLASRNLSEDPIVHPGDLVYVPQNTSSRIRTFIPTPSMGAYYTPNPF